MAVAVEGGKGRAEERQRLRVNDGSAALLPLSSDLGLSAVRAGQVLSDLSSAQLRSQPPPQSRLSVPSLSWPGSAT